MTLTPRVEPLTGNPYCEARLWMRGEDRACGQRVGVTRWDDHTGKPHVACSRHVGGMKRRHPETVPERLPHHGQLGLSTPWTRGKFAPTDVIEVENLIPEGYQINVTAYNGSPRSFNLTGFRVEPDGARFALLAVVNRHDPVNAAKVMALRLRDIEAESPDPVVTR